MTIVMPSLELAAEKVAQFEGFRSEPYLDSASIATIGYGSTRYPSDKAVTMQDKPISTAEALAFLEHDLTNAAVNLWKSITRQPSLNQWSALVSLAYNAGWPSIAKSTLVRLFNEGSVSASEHFLDWNKAHVDGQLVAVKGLTNRRMAEKALFDTQDGFIV